MNEQEFVERMKNYSPAVDEHAWVDYIAPLIGVMAVADLPDEVVAKYIDAMFGTMPIDVSVTALAKVNAMASMLGGTEN